MKYEFICLIMFYLDWRMVLTEMRQITHRVIDIVQDKNATFRYQFVRQNLYMYLFSRLMNE